MLHFILIACLIVLRDIGDDGFGASPSYAILEVLEIDDEQLPKYRGRKVVDHIIRVKASNRCVKYSLFFMLSRMLGFWHSVCSTKYPC